MAIGCNYPTAIRAFRKTFKEKTLINWDDRISMAAERSRRDHLARVHRTRSLSDDGESVKARPLMWRERTTMEAVMAKEREDFGNRPFLYHPPLYGPRGVLPETEKEVFPKLGPSIATSKSGQMGGQKIELWMSGADGASRPLGGEEGRDYPQERTADFQTFMSGALDANDQAKSLPHIELGIGEAEQELISRTIYALGRDDEVLETQGDSTQACETRIVLAKKTESEASTDEQKKQLLPLVDKSQPRAMDLGPSMQGVKRKAMTRSAATSAFVHVEEKQPERKAQWVKKQKVYGRDGTASPRFGQEDVDDQAEGELQQVAADGVEGEAMES